MFEIGELICYPMHGVGVIQSIDERTVLGESDDYYTVRFLSNNMTVMVRVSTASAVGVRRIIRADECPNVLKYLDEEPLPEKVRNFAVFACNLGLDIKPLNQRYRENLEKLKRGTIYEVADVVKCLRKRNNDKGLSSGERKMFLSAKQALIDEIAIASGVDTQVIEQAL